MISKKNILFLLLITVGFIVAINGCRPDEQPVEVKEPLTFDIPDGWPAANYNFEGNPLSHEKFELGRRLFYDTRLSRTNTVSCGTCHQLFSAFAQLDHNLSHGVENRAGIRNSPPLFNLNWHNNFFWDGGANHIEVQPLDPITNPLEMDESIDNIIAKLSSDEEYLNLFTKAWGDDEISTSRIMKSLAQFMGLMISNNSKYDQVQRGAAHFTSLEDEGYEIFKTNCASCHTEPLFSDFSFKSNGLPIIALASGFVDSGRGRIPPFDSTNLYKFKIPSLRNLKYTFPYMHDGRLNTIDDVLDHYANIDSMAFNLDPSLKNGIVLTAGERDALKAFLNTLNDSIFVTNQRFAEP